jgi:hypothetical protein
MIIALESCSRLQKYDQSMGGKPHALSSVMHAREPVSDFIPKALSLRATAPAVNQLNFIPILAINILIGCALQMHSRMILSTVAFGCCGISSQKRGTYR